VDLAVKDPWNPSAFSKKPYGECCLDLRGFRIETRPLSQNRRREITGPLEKKGSPARTPKNAFTANLSFLGFDRMKDEVIPANVQ
jgi:hypothetical protein